MRTHVGFRLVVACVLALASLVGLTACALARTPVPTVAELSGSWVNQGDPGTLDLKSDGTFSMTGVPKGVIDGNGVTVQGKPTGVPVDGTSTWHRGDQKGVLREPTTDDPIVYLLFDHNPQVYALNLYVAGAGKSRSLFIPIGDPDQHFAYVLRR